MEKRISSVFVALALCLALLPATAVWASEPTEFYDLYIAGTQVTDLSAPDLSVIDGVTGSASYDPDANTLFLKGVTIDNGIEGSGGCGIMYKGSEDFKISVSESNIVTVSAVQSGGTGGITIGVPGTRMTSAIPKIDLVIELSEGSSLTASGGTVGSGNDTSSYGVQNGYEGDVVIRGSGKLEAYGGAAEYSYGISAGMGDVCISGECSVEGGGAAGTFYSAGISGNDVYIDGASVVAWGCDVQYESDGLLAYGGWLNKGDIRISSGSVKAFAGKAELSRGIQFDKDLIIEESDVEASGEAYALTKAPVLPDGTFAEASPHYDGSAAELCYPADISRYLWFRFPFALPAADKLGDVDLDGSVGASDLTALARHVAQISVIRAPQGVANADVNGDGSVDASDLTKLARFVAHIIDAL